MFDAASDMDTDTASVNQLWITYLILNLEGMLHQLVLFKMSGVNDTQYDFLLVFRKVTVMDCWMTSTLYHLFYLLGSD